MQVRAENSQSSPHTYVLHLNSLEDYVVQAFLLFIQNGTSKRCYKKKVDRRLGEREGVVIFTRTEYYFQATWSHILYLHHTTGTVERTTYWQINRTSYLNFILSCILPCWIHCWSNSSFRFCIFSNLPWRYSFSWLSWLTSDLQK